VALDESCIGFFASIVCLSNTHSSDGARHPPREKPRDRRDVHASACALCTARCVPCSAAAGADARLVRSPPSQCGAGSERRARASDDGHPGRRAGRRVKMTRLRARVAERLKGAQNTYAMLTTFNEIDMTNLMKLRTDFKARRTDFKACLSADRASRAPCGRMSTVLSMSGRGGERWCAGRTSSWIRTASSSASCPRLSRRRATRCKRCARRAAGAALTGPGSAA
jgi:hypothetical protein